MEPTFSMAHQPVLSELCSICHINNPQYRCPRCACQTCSAHCVKQHKEWHQCSGKRDPTAKVSKSKLFTPAGIDHDYNFITSIERSRANLETKLPVDKPVEAHSLRAGIDCRNKNIQDRLDMTRVNIEWAPTGLSRQRSNQTRWSKKTRKIIWTVEWIHQDGHGELHEIHDSTPLCTYYAPIFLKHNKAQGGRKRKYSAGLPKPSALPESEKHDQERSTLSTSNHVDFDNDSGRHEKAVESLTSVETVPNIIDEDLARTDTPRPKDAGNKRDPVVEVKSYSHNTRATLTSELLRQPPGSPDDKGNYYYLVKPRTTATEKVLIVLSPTDSLLDCLKNQTVLEFPTIQVLSSPPQALPMGFVLEDDWLERFNEEQSEMKRLLEEAGGFGAGEAHQEIVEEALPPGLKKMSNTNDILTILERDVLERKDLWLKGCETDETFVPAVSAGEQRVDGRI